MITIAGSVLPATDGFKLCSPSSRLEENKILRLTDPNMVSPLSLDAVINKTKEFFGETSQKTIDDLPGMLSQNFSASIVALGSLQVYDKDETTTALVNSPKILLYAD